MERSKQTSNSDKTSESEEKNSNFLTLPLYLLDWVEENLDEIILITNDDGTIEFISSSVERLLGYKKEELIGSSWQGKTSKENVKYILSNFDEDSCDKQFFIIGDPEIRSHDRIVVIAHATGRDRVKDGGGDVTGGPGERLLSLDVAARQMLLWRKAPEGGGCHEPAGMADRLNGDPPIHLGAEVVWPDLGCDCRIGTRNVAAPPTFRTQIAHRDGQGREAVQGLAEAVE
mgnify:CR=1 FL=1